MRKRLSKFDAVSRCVIFLFAAVLWLTCSSVPDSCGDQYEVFDPKSQKCGSDGIVYDVCANGNLVPAGTRCDVTTPDTVKYAVTVSSEGVGATGDGEYPLYAMVTVTAGTPPSGSQFIRWESSGDAVTFVPGADYPTVMFSMPARAVTVTAVFEEMPQTVKHAVTVESEGAGASRDSVYAAGDTVAITAGTPPSGRQFIRWVSSVAGVTFFPSANNVTVMFTMPDTVLKVTAVFEDISETAKKITFNAGVSRDSGYTNAYGKLASLPTPTRNGYTFGGWFTTQADTGGTRVDTSMVFNTDTVIYARWAITTYTITYTLNGGALDTANANPTSYTIETDTFTLKNPTKTDSTFVGWTGTNVTKADTVVTIAKGSTGNRSYTANWLPLPAGGSTYTLTVNRNPAAGGSTTPNGSQSGISAGDTVRISATASSGYKFKNWTSTDTAIQFGKADSVRTTFIMPARAVTITANFEADTTATKYKVTVVSVGAGASDSGSYKANDTVKIRAGTPPAGKIFNNWTSTDSASVKFNNASKDSTWFIMPAKAVTVTANFTQTGKISSDSLTYKGKKYPTVEIGGKIWMASNLNYDTLDGTGSWCYDDDSTNCGKYGRLYNWNTAKAVCPTGWSLPDTSDWRKLVATVGGDTVAGEKLKAATNDWKENGKGTDNFGFSALPGGRLLIDFDEAGSAGYWWTAIAKDDDYAYNRIMSYSEKRVTDGNAKKEYGNSVRCVKNDPVPVPSLSKAKR
ncbi:MAG: InlB B-repeat-containing protein [Chitinispirillales bacterium]|nr:InlB B-repeat-containing protein [Chitinispirillales bacterium]